MILIVLYDTLETRFYRMDTHKKPLVFFSTGKKNFRKKDEGLCWLAEK
jgi:hypothetical protein